MTDTIPPEEAPPEEAPPAPPKKRSFFKKTAPKAENAKRDIFSHSSEITELVAEETRRKAEARRRKEEEEQQRETERRERKKRKNEEERGAKRRRISDETSLVEDADVYVKTRGSRGDGIEGRDRRERKSRSRTPESSLPTLPAPKKESSLSAQYDSLAQSTVPVGSPPKHRKSDMIDLGSSDEDDSDADDWKAPQSTVPLYPSRPADTEEIEEVEDPALEAIRANIRARAAKNKEDRVVQLFITSTIPNTKELMVKIKTSSSLERPRLAWCGIQEFPQEVTDDVFFTWAHKKIFDSTKVMRLCSAADLEDDIYDDDNMPQIHVEAWTGELFRACEEQEKQDKSAREKAAETSLQVEEEEPPPPSQPAKKIRLILKARGKDDFKIAVNPDTTIEQLACAYKTSRKVPFSDPITLMWDGDRLRPMDIIEDTEIEDMDTIEVHFK